MEFIALDYTTLRVIWWLLLGILLVGWAVMDGFDLASAPCCHSWPRPMKNAGW